MQDSTPKFVQEIDQGFGNIIEIKACLCDVQSDYQHIQIFETANLGKLMMLDGIIQFTEYDEYAYQEMMTHPAMMLHKNPEKVLIIGGGDGGVAREVARHQCVKQIDHCEIDGKVVEMCKKFVPGMACGFDDPRLNLHIGDGLEFVRNKVDEYDVIIVDSTDPIGPGAVLFGREFYQSVHRALKADGVVASQSESIFLYPEIVQRLYGFTRELFAYNGYAFIAVPTYPAGSIGVCLANKKYPVEKPLRELDDALASQLRYYTPEIHSAAFKLPAFAQRWFTQSK
ncbi:MAG: polyamine aminopropyltransferase [Lentisphaerae bacterium]|nr:polyamine aminopropyltransferase [Lentisphaerota bacterium]